MLRALDAVAVRLWFGFVDSWFAQAFIRFRHAEPLTPGQSWLIVAAAWVLLLSLAWLFIAVGNRCEAWRKRRSGRRAMEREILLDRLRRNGPPAIEDLERRRLEAVALSRRDPAV